MSNPKDTLVNFWVTYTNQLLGKLKLETVQPNELVNLSVQNTEEILTITVVCTSKLLVLTLDGNTNKLTGGWKHY